MTSSPDRQHALELVNEARASGARLKSACAELGIDVNTYRRWSRDLADKRPTANRPTPAHALSEAERQAILDACHRARRHAMWPMARIRCGRTTWSATRRFLTVRRCETVATRLSQQPRTS